MKRKTVVSMVILFMLLAVLSASNGNSINVAMSAGKQNQEAQLQSGELVKTLDERFAEIAKQLPGFGGMFFDQGGTLQVYLLDQKEPVDQSLMTALEEVITKEVFNGERLSQAGIEVLEGQYSFSQLQGWHDQMSIPLFEIPGMVFTDIDERKNRLQIGVEDLGAAQSAVEQYLAKLGIPREAVLIEQVEPVRLELRGRHRPLVGGLQINFSINKLCSLGFIAERNGVRGFVTNSHCTSIKGEVEGTNYHQPSVSGATNRIGREIADPAYFTGGVCPFGFRCRYSDSAFVKSPHPSGPAVGTKLGFIARPPVGSFDWSGVRTFQITGEADPIVGQAVSKVGRTTGRTSGVVDGTCLNTRVSDTNVILLCQSRASCASAPGDSGSPIFQITSLPNAVLGGILWGGYPGGGATFFSPISNIQRAGELGSLTTCAGGGC